MNWIDIILIVLAVITIPVGIISCIIPPLPGPIVGWLGLLCTRFVEDGKYISVKELIIFGILCVAVLVIDYFLPIIATKKFGGTNWGVWGGVIGTIIGAFFLPGWGIIVGPLVGAIVGDLIGGNRIKSALKSGFGNFLGFLASTGIKVTLCMVMGGFIVFDVFGLVSTAVKQLF